MTVHGGDLMIRNKKELLAALETEYRVTGSVITLALAYLIRDICADGRTTAFVFNKAKKTKKR